MTRWCQTRYYRAHDAGLTGAVVGTSDHFPADGARCALEVGHIGAHLFARANPLSETCPDCRLPLAVQADYDCPCEGNTCASCDAKCWRAENNDTCVTAHVPASTHAASVHATEVIWTAEVEYLRATIAKLRKGECLGVIPPTDVPCQRDAYCSIACQTRDADGSRSDLSRTLIPEKFWCRCDEVDDNTDPPTSVRCPVHDASFDREAAMERARRVLDDRSGFHTDELDEATRKDMLGAIVDAVRGAT